MNLVKKIIYLSLLVCCLAACDRIQRMRPPPPGIDPNDGVKGAGVVAFPMSRTTKIQQYASTVVSGRTANAPAASHLKASTAKAVSESELPSTQSDSLMPPTSSASESKIEKVKVKEKSISFEDSADDAGAATKSAPVLAKNTASSIVDESAKASYKWMDETRIKESDDRIKEADAAMSTPCQSAYKEALQGKQAEESSEKLFRFRRALRLCPAESPLHNGLGEVYLSLNRKNDAEFEFKEAVKLDPAFERANLNLERVGGGNKKN